MSAAEDRLKIGEGAVFSVSQAAYLLPWDTAAAGQWLRREGLISLVDGRELVVWRAVLRRLEQLSPAAAPRPTTKAKATTKLPRVRID